MLPPDIASVSRGGTGEVAELLRLIAGTQSEHQRVVLQRMDQLEKCLGCLVPGGLAMCPPLAPFTQAQERSSLDATSGNGTLGAPGETPNCVDAAAGSARSTGSPGGADPERAPKQSPRTAHRHEENELQDAIRAEELDGTWAARTEARPEGPERSSEQSSSEGPGEGHPRRARTPMGAARRGAASAATGVSVATAASVAARPAHRAALRQASVRGAYSGVLLQRLGHKGTMAAFHDILQEERSFRAWCLRKLSHPMFDMIMGIVIVLNSIIIGVELTVQPIDESESSSETRLLFDVCEHVFLCIYVLELLCRLYACRTACLRNGWVRFDVFLVIMGVLGAWVAPLIISVGGDSIRNAGPSPLFLRVFRLARVARALRLFVQFRTLWMLVSGLSSSFPNVLNVFLVLSLTLFVFSCLAVEVIAKERNSNGQVFQALVDQYWSSLPVIMMTLVQFVTLDTVGEIYKPMIADNILLVFYFLPFMLMVSVILMNLVMAVVIQTFMDHVKRDEETRQLWNKQRMLELMPRLTTVFEGLDMDGNGQITWEELKCAPTDVKMELECLLSVDSLADLFEALDEDGNMQVSSEEFFDGMTRLICGNSSLDITRILRMLRSIRRDIQSLMGAPLDSKKRPSDAGSHLSDAIGRPAPETPQSF